uniref:nucleotidyltransferase domain-containing protein n=1 Tax=Olsenella timonensis TaxID=1805478 RepID=UPI00094E261A|nr:nucleotidyltransferase domain-containing protein [Olsenella timonensis]
MDKGYAAGITGIARLDEAIARIVGAAVADGLCEAALLRGSIARGDADEFSDIDLYLVVSPQNRDAVLGRREKYLAAYGDVVFVEDVDFGLPQKVAIFSDALHVDLYVAEPQQVGSLDPVVAVYDPAGRFGSVSPARPDVTDEELCRHFSSVLYCLVEASSAYGRRNNAWAAKIMSDAVGELSVLVRSLYDRCYAFLGLKKLNEVVPAEDYRLFEDVYACVGRGDFPEAARTVLNVLDAFLANADEGLAPHLDARFLAWAKRSLGTLLFAERRNVLVADVPITSPRTYEEFRASLEDGAVIGTAFVEVDDEAPRIPWWPDHKIVPGTKTPAELRAWLEEHLDLEPEPLEGVSQARLWAMRHNIETSLGIDGSNLEFVAYRILPTERNAPYLEDVPQNCVGEPEPAIALMELRTGFVDLQCPRLFHEYVVARGVSQEDLTEKTVNLQDYLFHLRSLEDPGWK